MALLEPQSSSTYATWFSWKNESNSFKNIGITKDLLQTDWIPLKSLMNGLLEQHHIRHTHHYREFVVRLSLSASMKHKSKGFACPASTSSANCRNPSKAFCFRSWIRWDKALRWIMSSHKDSAHLWWTCEHVKFGATTDWRNWSTLQATIVIIVSIREAACVCAETIKEHHPWHCCFQVSSTGLPMVIPSILSKMMKKQKTNSNVFSLVPSWVFAVWENMAESTIDFNYWTLE